MIRAFLTLTLTLILINIAQFFSLLFDPFNGIFWHLASSPLMRCAVLKRSALSTEWRCLVSALVETFPAHVFWASLFFAELFRKAANFPKSAFHRWQTLHLLGFVAVDWRRRASSPLQLRTELKHAAFGTVWRWLFCAKLLSLWIACQLATFFHGGAVLFTPAHPFAIRRWRKITMDLGFIAEDWLRRAAEFLQLTPLEWNALRTVWPWPRSAFHFVWKTLYTINDECFFIMIVIIVIIFRATFFIWCAEIFSVTKLAVRRWRHMANHLELPIAVDFRRWASPLSRRTKLIRNAIRTVC